MLNHDDKKELDVLCSQLIEYTLRSGEAAQELEVLEARVAKLRDELRYSRSMEEHARSAVMHAFEHNDLYYYRYAGFAFSRPVVATALDLLRITARGRDRVTFVPEPLQGDGAAPCASDGLAHPSSAL